jgi:hypothetical protein
MIETRESMLYALPPVPEVPLKLAGTANLRQADPDRPEPVSPEEAKAVLEAFRPYLPNIEHYRVIGTAMGHYGGAHDGAREDCRVASITARRSPVLTLASTLRSNLLVAAHR